MNTIKSDLRNKERDRSIDLLRALGVILIVLAHCNGLPDSVFELRAFDVVLMVFLSGICFSGKIIKNLYDFYTKRTLRLIVPVYLFFTIYFGLIGILVLNGADPGNLTFRKVIDTYLLYYGIGYVWIIRVFLLVMLLTPPLLWIYRRITHPMIWLFVACVIQTVLTYLCSTYITSPILRFIIINYLLLYATGYSIVFLVGCAMANKNKSKIGIWLWFIAFIGLAVYFALQPHHDNDFFLPVNAYKYPPQGLYLIYGVSCCIILNEMRGILHKAANKVTDFIGSNTMWIYLFHIPLLMSSRFIHNWVIQFIFVSTTAVLMTFALNRFSYFCDKRFPSPFWKYLRG